jgi:PLP dependent protein
MLAENIKSISAELAPFPHVTLIAVTKTKPLEVLKEAYDLGLRVFGENRVQELVPKYEALPKDISWHLIGHLQSNKVKYITPFISMIQSVDSLTLLKEIDKQAKKSNRLINCLLQIYIAQEESKFGLDREELIALLESEELKMMQNISLKGLMGMATNTTNEAQIRKEFQFLKHLFEDLKQKYQTHNVDFEEVSFGMSSDYWIAIEEGSTMIRVGSKIFGSR